jgi:hypothetical protein
VPLRWLGVLEGEGEAGFGSTTVMRGFRFARVFTTGRPRSRRTDGRQGDENQMNVALATDSRAAALAAVTPIGIFQRRHPIAVAHKGPPS